MKRRIFLHSGALGLLGAGMPAGLFYPAFDARSGIFHWLQQLTTALDVRRRMTLLSASKPLQTQMQRTDAFLSARGYVRPDSNLFFYPNSTNRCFYVLRHTYGGLADVLVPVLAQAPDGAWQQVLVLTGFQMEALARAAAALKSSEYALAGLVLPTGPMQGGDTYPTALGSVRTGTRLHDSQASTHITIKAGQEIVFTEDFVSEHGLNSTPGAGA